MFQRKPLRYVKKAVDIGSTDTLDSKVQEPLPIETAEELNFNSYQSKLTSLNQEKSTAPPATQEIGTQQQEYSIVMDHDVPSMLDSYHAVKSQEKIRSLYSHPFNLVEWGREMRRQKELQSGRSHKRNANFMVTGLNLKSKLQTLSASKERKSAKHARNQHTGYDPSDPLKTKSGGAPLDATIRLRSSPEKKLNESKVLKILEMRINSNDHSNKSSRLTRSRENQ